MFIIIMETSVRTKNDQEMIEISLDKLTGPEHWSIDLGDCQRVLRVVSLQNITQQIVHILEVSGFAYSIMDVFYYEDHICSQNMD